MDFLKIWENPPSHFVSCVMVWAAGVKVVGSSPTGGILAKMCACECNAFTHTISRNFPSVGREPETLTPAAQTSTQLTKWADGFSQISREIAGNPCVSKMAPFWLANRG